jgi:hypothetical protein
VPKVAVDYELRSYGEGTLIAGVLSPDLARKLEARKIGYEEWATLKPIDEVLDVLKGLGAGVVVKVKIEP